MCDKYVKAKCKYKQFKPNIHKEFDKCKHIFLSLKDIDIKDVDETFYLYIIEHNKKFDYYLVKRQFKIIFNDYQYCPYITSKISDNKTMISGSNFLENVIGDSKDEGYNFNHTAEMDFITIANKMDM